MQMMQKLSSFFVVILDLIKLIIICIQLGTLCFTTPDSVLPMSIYSEAQHAQLLQVLQLMASHLPENTYQHIKMGAVTVILNQ